MVNPALSRVIRSSSNKHRHSATSRGSTLGSRYEGGATPPAVENVDHNPVNVCPLRGRRSPPRCKPQLKNEPARLWRSNHFGNRASSLLSALDARFREVAGTISERLSDNACRSCGGRQNQNWTSTWPDRWRESVVHVLQVDSFQVGMSDLARAHRRH
jgi:hypothetical protein